MNILLVGGKSDLSKYLYPILSKNHNVITAGRHGCDVEMDITKDINIPDDIDVIINTAGYFNINSDEDYLNAIDVNVLGALKLCIEAKGKNVKHIIHISSISAEIDDEKSKFYSIYAISKRQADEVLENYCKKNNLNYTILRPSQLYGVNTKKEHQPLFYLMLDKASKGEKISIYGTNDAKRNYINFEDFANIVSKVVELKIFGKYSCQYPQNLSYSQIAKTAFNVFGYKENIKFLKEKADIPDNIFDYNDDLYKKINYYPQIDIEKGIKIYKGDK